MSASRPTVRAWLVPDVLERAPPRPAPAAPPPPPALTEQDVAAALDRGLQEGARRAGDEAAARAAVALRDIAGALARLAEEWAARAEQEAEGLAGILIAALAAAFPKLEAAWGPPAAASVMRALLPGLAREAAVTVRVAPAAVAALVSCCDGRPDLAGRLSIEPDETLGAADLRVAWRDGAASRDAAAIRAAVLDALSGLCRTPATEGAVR